MSQYKDKELTEAELEAVVGGHIIPNLLSTVPDGSGASMTFEKQRNKLNAEKSLRGVDEAPIDADQQPF